MSTLTPINGWAIPSLSDSPNITSAVNTAISAIDARANPIFSTTAARNAAITSPTAGQECYVTATKEKYVYNGTAWIGVVPRFAIKTSDQTITNTTSFVNDTELFMSVEANSTYHVVLQIRHRVSVITSDWKFQFAGPSGAVLTGVARGNLGGAGDGYEEFCSSGFIGTLNVLVDTTVDFPLEYDCILTTTNAGTLQFQYAQFAAVASNNTVRGTTYLKLLKIG